MAIPTRYPDAVWRPPPGMYVGPVRQKTDLVIWHVDAGNANSLYGWWNQSGSGQNGSHFFVKTDGTVEQYAPIDRITWTSGNGSLRSVGIETQGYAAGEWTPAQRAALIKLTRWLCSTLGVPMVMAPNSKLTSRGIAWHRQGVPATQAQKAAKVSQTGGELWSSSVGKVCPGPDREKQIPHMVGEIANQSITPNPNTEDDDIMATKEEVADEIFGRTFTTPGGTTTNLQQLIRWHDNGTVQIMDAIKAVVPVIVNGVFNTPINRSGAAGTTSLAATLAWNDRNIDSTREVIRDTGAAVLSAVEAASDSDADEVAKQVTERVIADVENALRGVNLTPHEV